MDTTAKIKKGGVVTHEELWPDAFEAPDVPDRNIIGLFLDSQEKLDPDMREQIRMSEDCQRALQQLQRERIFEASPESAMDEEIHAAAWKAAWESFKAKSSNKKKFFKEEGESESEQKAMPPTPNPSPSSPVPYIRPPQIAVGQIWNIANQCQVWSGTRLVNWQIFLLQRVLVVALPHTMPWGDSVIRIVPVVDTFLCPDGYRSAGDILLEERAPGFWDDLVVHPYLEFPMSVRQLGNYIGDISAPNKEKLERVLRAVRGGHEYPPEFKEDTMFKDLPLKYREETLEEVRWVSATADALRLAWECEISN